jgi:hypothetical protein
MKYDTPDVLTLSVFGGGDARYEWKSSLKEKPRTQAHTTESYGYGAAPLVVSMGVVPSGAVESPT